MNHSEQTIFDNLLSYLSLDPFDEMPACISILNKDLLFLRDGIRALFWDARRPQYKDRKRERTVCSRLRVLK